MIPEVWVSLGSNLGDRRAHLHFGLKRIADLGSISRVSSIYETEPWGKKDQPAFLNAVCSLFPSAADPEGFWGALKVIEQNAGRTVTERWGPRILDLDLLFWGRLVVNTDSLTIPHPHIAERRFVLIPLAELEPDLMHPVSGITVRQMLDECGDCGEVTPRGKFSTKANG